MLSNAVSVFQGGQGRLSLHFGRRITRRWRHPTACRPQNSGRPCGGGCLWWCRCAGEQAIHQLSYRQPAPPTSPQGHVPSGAHDNKGTPCALLRSHTAKHPRTTRSWAPPSSAAPRPSPSARRAPAGGRSRPGGDDVWIATRSCNSATGRGQHGGRGWQAGRSTGVHRRACRLRRALGPRALTPTTTSHDHNHTRSVCGAPRRPPCQAPRSTGRSRCSSCPQTAPCGARRAPCG